MRRNLMLLLVLVFATLGVGLAQDAAAPSPFQSHIAGAEKLGDGELVAYRTADKTMLAIGQSVLDRLMMWYAEAARFPPAVVNANAIGTTVIRMERHGSRLIVRDQAPALEKRAGEDPFGDVHAPVSDPKLTPIDVAIEATSLGPAIAVLPIVAEENGTLLVDITAAFSGDFDSLTAAPHILQAGLVPMPFPATIDANRSYIADVDVYSDNLHIRSHITFRAMDPHAPGSGPRPVSIEVGHSIVLLPETPMRARQFDERVGFFHGEFSEYETPEGAARGSSRIIHRYRLEKADPSAPVSDPIEPIVFYVGQGVPERWRPYIASGIESWQPVFEAAGFSNAIVAKQAPSPEEDPEFSPEDARVSIIRWMAQEMPNAMGPRVADPRSGEILFAHILIWPDVINFFSDYYYLVANGIDPDVRGLPLSEEKQGEILAYAVAHEVGHSMGLRHNHLASTAYSVAELRDPAFANERGPNASVMAYGRFNYVAQPGDGVTRVMPVHGPADHFAISWGYGVHGETPEQEQAELDRMAAAASKDPLRRWAAGEMGSEAAWMFDPRVLKENVGSERIEATRLGLATIRRTMEGLDEAAGANDTLFRRVYRVAISRQVLLVDSVAKLVGGQLVSQGDESRPAIVAREEQRQAVRFLLNEGAASFDIFLKPDLLLRADSIGGDRIIEIHQSALVRNLLSGQKLALLETQSRLIPGAYDVADLAEDVTAAVWGDLSDLPPRRESQQAAYLDRVAEILSPSRPSPAAVGQVAAVLTGQGYPEGYIANKLATGADTVFPAFARESLPKLKARLEGAAAAESDASTRLHLLDMAHRIEDILRK